MGPKAKTILKKNKLYDSTLSDSKTYKAITSKTLGFTQGQTRDLMVGKQTR